MKLTVEFDRETDGRWIAEVPELAGVLVYGQTKDEALAKAQALALQAIAEMLEHGELAPETEIAFQEAPAA
jgi:predicted RNase H-like HicB family nuclease